MKGEETKYIKRTIKLQQPLATNEEPEILIYDESREHTFTLPAPAKTLKEIFGDELKVYWSAMIPVGGEPADIELLQEVDEEDW